MNICICLFVYISILFNPLASCTIITWPMSWTEVSNTTTTSHHVSGDLIMLIVMLTMAGLLVICGAVFGIYVLCHRKKSQYEPIA